MTWHIYRQKTDKRSKRPNVRRKQPIPAGRPGTSTNKRPTKPRKCPSVRITDLEYVRVSLVRFLVLLLVVDERHRFLEALLCLRLGEILVQLNLGERQGKASNGLHCTQSDMSSGLILNRKVVKWKPRGCTNVS